MRFFRRPPAHIWCQQVVEMVSDYLEGTLPATERRRLDHHFSICAPCATYLEQMRETLRLTGALVPEDLSPEMEQEFSEIYRRWRTEG
ncbi:MAG TPA: zf-HC2 domain-containing protein [Solirubrobacteraceae bacterium]|nr:zf-HC2 domain-containing protein [Solirubrobacteraceae bacterium]